MNNKYSRFIVVDSYGHGIYGCHDVTRVYYGDDVVRAFKKGLSYFRECSAECDLHFYDLAKGMSISINGGVSVSDLLDFYHRYEG